MVFVSSTNKIKIYREEGEKKRKLLCSCSRNEGRIANKRHLWARARTVRGHIQYQGDMRLMLALRASCGLKAARSEAAASARSRLRGRAITGRRLSSSSSSSKISSFSSDDVEGGDGTSFPVFEKMAGEWEDSVRYVHATMEETPRVKLTGTREVRGTLTILPKKTTPSFFFNLSPINQRCLLALQTILLVLQIKQTS